MATTRKVLAAVPDDQAGYKPHEKYMSAGELAAHLAFVDIWFLQSVVAGEFASPEQPAEPPTPSAALAAYDGAMPDLVAKLKDLTGDQLAKLTTFYSWSMPLVSYVSFMLNHSIHHRGQLSTYLRPMGAKVPAIYGGSADEPMQAS